jgi:chlorite dismutase
MSQAQQPSIQHASDHPMKPAIKGPLFVSFVAGPTGLWKVDHVNAVVGESLPKAERLDVIEAPTLQSSVFGGWTLRGVTSNTRYSTRSEVQTMKSILEGLGRPQATRAALIPIRKSEAWWALAQDERRAIFEDQSHHIAMSLEYLPRVSRRLHHSRELAEPFDFLTWFEYAPEHSDAFEDLVQKLRASKEWTYVDREVDIRLSRS